MIEFENAATIFNEILGLRPCPQYTLNNVLLNFIRHMKKWGRQLDMHPPNPKIGQEVSPHPPPLPRIDALAYLTEFSVYLICKD